LKSSLSSLKKKRTSGVACHLEQECLEKPDTPFGFARYWNSSQVNYSEQSAGQRLTSLPVITLPSKGTKVRLNHKRLLLVSISLQLANIITNRNQGAF